MTAAGPALACTAGRTSRAPRCPPAGLGVPPPRRPGADLLGDVVSGKPSAATPHPRDELGARPERGVHRLWRRCGSGAGRRAAAAVVARLGPVRRRRAARMGAWWRRGGRGAGSAATPGSLAGGRWHRHSWNAVSARAASTSPSFIASAALSSRMTVPRVQPAVGGVGALAHPEALAVGAQGEARPRRRAAVTPGREHLGREGGPHASGFHVHGDAPHPRRPRHRPARAVSCGRPVPARQRACGRAHPPRGPPRRLRRVSARTPIGCSPPGAATLKVARQSPSARRPARRRRQL